MTPTYRNMYKQVQRLLDRCNDEVEQLCHRRPPGYQSIYNQMMSAYHSGAAAVEPGYVNYTSLVLARDELRQVVYCSPEFHRSFRQ